MQSNIAMLGSSVTCEGCLAGVTTSAAAHSVAHGEEARRARTNNAAFFTVRSSSPNTHVYSNIAIHRTHRRRCEPR